MCEYYLLKRQKQSMLAHVERDLLKARINKQLKLRLLLLLLFSNHDLEPWDESAQRHLQQKKEMCQMSSLHGDQHFGLEQEFVSCHQWAEKLWRSLEDVRHKFSACSWMYSCGCEQTKEAFNKPLLEE